MVVGLAMNSAAKKLNSNQFKNKTSSGISSIASKTLEKLMQDEKTLVRLQNLISSVGTKASGEMLHDEKVRKGVAMVLTNVARNQELAKVLSGKNGAVSVVTRTAIKAAASQARREALKALAMAAGAYGAYRMGKRFLLGKKK